MTRPRLVKLQRVADSRGDILVVTTSRRLPSDVRRVFFIDSQESRVDRGGHAHRECHQFVIILKGSADFLAGGAHFYLRAGCDHGLYVPPLTWLDVSLNPYALLAVLASHEYDEADYIRDHEAFARLAA